MIFKPDNCQLYELVDKRTYEKYGEFAWHFLDERLLRAIEFLGKEFGVLYINTWNWDEEDGSQNRGFRSWYSDVGSKYSSHRRGTASDITFKDRTAQEVRDWLEEHYENTDFYKEHGIKITVEEDVTWLHISVENNHNAYNSFKP